MKKKILFITKALWIGGIETALINLLPHLNPEQYDLTCLLLQDEKPLADRLPKSCRLLVADREHPVSFQKPYRFARLFHLTETPAHPSGLHRAMMWMVPAIRWLENRLYISYIRKQMKNEHFDTCVIYSDVAGETAVRAIDADRFLMYYHHGAMRRVYHDEIAWKKSEKIIAVSQNQAVALRTFVPQYAEKITVIHNLADVDGVLEKAHRPCGQIFDPERFNIVSVGRVSHEKGMDLAVRACAELVHTGYPQICWWIVGGGPAMDEVRQAVRETHMEDHVQLVGMQSNPYPYMRQADLYVQPSRFESYGITIIEAMQLEKCIVSTENPGSREIITSGKNGILCPIDAKAIAAAVRTLLTEPQKRRQMERTAQQLNLNEKNQAEVQKLTELL